MRCGLYSYEVCLCTGCGDHRDLHGRTLSCPTRRSSGLVDRAAFGAVGAQRQRDRLRRRQRARGLLAIGVERLDAVRDLLAAETVGVIRSEEHTSELQSLMRISYAVFCLKKNKDKT